MEKRLLAVEATGLGLRTRRGPVYGPLDLALSPGAIVAFSGAAGSGKTALLLTIGGRMRPTSGSLKVMGADAVRHPAIARSRCGLAVFPGLNDLADALTVGSTIAADGALAGRARTSHAAEAALHRVGLEVDPQAKVGDLDEVERTLLGVALALAGDPAVLLIDDVGAGLTPVQRVRLHSALRGAADSGVTVACSCVDPCVVPLADIVVPMSPLAESEAAACAL